MGTKVVKIVQTGHPSLYLLAQYFGFVGESGAQTEQVAQSGLGCIVHVLW